jgi:acetolactate synthase-1/2/3 large subunit
MKNGMPEFSEVSKAYGLLGYKINTLEELKTLIPKIKNNKKAIIIDVNVIENENCYPMVSPGKSNAQMIGLHPQSGIVTEFVKV